MNEKSESCRPIGTAWWIIIIVAFGGLLRLVSFTGYVGSDDGAYAAFAHQVSIGEFRIGQNRDVPVFPLRVGLIAPTALAFKIAGTRESVMVVYPFLLSLLGIVIAFLAGREFFGERAGLIAAVCMAMHPMDTREATSLLPDLPAAFWANAGLLIIYWGAKQPSYLARIGCGTIAGLVFGLSWLCKESVAYLLPFVGLYLLWLLCHDRRNLTLAGGTAVLFLAMLVTEAVVYRFHTGDLLFRVHEMERNYVYEEFQPAFRGGRMNC